MQNQKYYSKLLLIASLFFSLHYISAQEAIVLNETFDADTGFVVSTPFFSDGESDFFGLTSGNFGGGAPPSGLAEFSGFDGSFLVGEDLDAEGATLPITLTWSGLNIATLYDLTFSGDFAAGPDEIDPQDTILVSYRIDDGEFQPLLQFIPADFTGGTTNNPANGTFREDTSLDGMGDGTALSFASQTFTKSITGTGDSLALRLTLRLNSGNEEFGIDNFTIIGTVDISSIANVPAPGQWVISPNPVRDVATFTPPTDWQSLSAPVYVQIFNSLGQLQLQTKLQEDYQADMAHLERGWYHCRLVQGQQIIGKAFLVKQ